MEKIFIIRNLFDFRKLFEFAMITFGVNQVYRVFILVCLFLYELYNMRVKDTEWYNKERRLRLPYALQFSPVIFPIVWTLLKILLVLSHFFYFEYTVDAYYWSFPAVFICTLINIILMKMWSVLFFTQRRIGMALINAVLLVITSVLVTIFMGLSQPALGDLYYVPLVLYILYPCWLIVALVLNAYWFYSEPQVQSGGGAQPLMRKRLPQ